MKDKVALGGALIAAIAASLCCIGPLAALVLGLGAFGVGAAFESVRPYLIALTALLLAVAFYLANRKREGKCEDGSCETRIGRPSKIILWLAATAVAALVAFPYYSGALIQTSAQKNSRDFGNSRDSAAVIQVSGMTCDACAIEIGNALTKAPGVKSARVSYEQARAVVSYDQAETNIDAIRAAINSTGYKAGDVSQTAASPDPTPIEEPPRPQASPASESQQTQAIQTTRAQRKTAVIPVEGMTCGGCARSIEIALGKLKGVNSARVSLEKKQTRVIYDSGIVTLDQIKAAIEATGFKVGGIGRSARNKVAKVEEPDRDVSVTVLENLDRLRDQFRRDGDRVRLIALLSPT